MTSPRTRPVVVIDVVGLTPDLLVHMPRLSALAAAGFQAPLGTILPAVTCSVQSTLLTGALPREHGVVGNGWYFRELSEIWLWRQSNRLVGGEKLWDAARQAYGADVTVANLFWWYAMGASTDVAVTPRPVYYADGRKGPGVYTRPAALGEQLARRYGEFPLFDFWGPRAGLPSSRWIADAARWVFDQQRPNLTLVYLPHLDYDLQRFGSRGPEAKLAAAAIDEVAGALIDHVRASGAIVVVLSEYGITDVHRPVHVNRALREAGLLEVAYNPAGELLDTFASAAFAVADHQIAHVYVNDPKVLPRAREVVAQLPGVAEVLDHDGKRAAGLDHPRAGDLVAIADPEAWFTYYYWLDDARAPDFAPTVEIHRKPGYDPAELLFDGGAAKARAAVRLAQKALGLRYTMDVIPLDATGVRGSHGRLPARDGEGPVLLCSEGDQRRERFAATDVKGFILDLMRPR
ncbi:MAG TPA: alkaline phosphatase family protein [Kofleriaceae bacterium]|jgi:predicted AlkP superfamily pyrophosphatase or phosphodiesterase|nr:alkaline phosphatase family protein [Kofleriaceae bacterium]